MWISSKRHKRMRLAVADDDDDDEKLLPFPFPLALNKSTTPIESNRIYFNDDITNDSISELNSNLRVLDQKLFTLKHKFRLKEKIPIYLFLTTNGGSVYASLSAIDCINQLKCPVYTIVDGFVASAGTLISLAGVKRYIQPNAYMLIHEIRSSCWGKMSEISDEYENLKTLMVRLTDYYLTHTKLKKKDITKLLQKDITWDASECIKKGIVDDIFKANDEDDDE